MSAATHPEHAPERDHHRDATTERVLQTAKELPADRVQWLYHSSYYDGPISGRVLVKGPRGRWDSSASVLWAEMFEECNYTVEVDDEDRDFDYPCGFYRRYRLIELAPEADVEEARRHALFEEYVGTHTRYVYDEHGQRRRASVFNASERPNWHHFYDLAKTWPKWKPDGELIGWFQR